MRAGDPRRQAALLRAATWTRGCSPPPRGPARSRRRLSACLPTSGPDGGGQRVQGPLCPLYRCQRIYLPSESMFLQSTARVPRLREAPPPRHVRFSYVPGEIALCASTGDCSSLSYGVFVMPFSCGSHRGDKGRRRLCDHVAHRGLSCVRDRSAYASAFLGALCSWATTKSNVSPAAADIPKVLVAACVLCFLLHDGHHATERIVSVFQGRCPEKRSQTPPNGSTAVPV